MAKKRKSGREDNTEMLHKLLNDLTRRTGADIPDSVDDENLARKEHLSKLGKIAAEMLHQAVHTELVKREFKAQVDLLRSAISGFKASDQKKEKFLAGLDQLTEIFNRGMSPKKRSEQEEK